MPAPSRAVGQSRATQKAVGIGRFKAAENHGRLAPDIFRVMESVDFAAPLEVYIGEFAPRVLPWPKFVPMPLAARSGQRRPLAPRRRQGRPRRRVDVKNCYRVILRGRNRQEHSAFRRKLIYIAILRKRDRKDHSVLTVS